jgi:acyl-coenzyme A thioesterase PaaI-like protein
MLYVQSMTDEERLAHPQQFAERFCADLGLPPPARYTMADLITHDEALRAGDARVEAMVTRRNRNAARARGGCGCWTRRR